MVLLWGSPHVWKSLSFSNAGSVAKPIQQGEVLALGFQFFWRCLEAGSLLNALWNTWFWTVRKQTLHHFQACQGQRRRDPVCPPPLFSSPLRFLSSVLSSQHLGRQQCRVPSQVSVALSRLLPTHQVPGWQSTIDMELRKGDRVSFALQSAVSTALLGTEGSEMASPLFWQDQYGEWPLVDQCQGKETVRKGCWMGDGAGS